MFGSLAIASQSLILDAGAKAELTLTNVEHSESELEIMQSILGSLTFFKIEFSV